MIAIVESSTACRSNAPRPGGVEWDDEGFGICLSLS